MQKEDLDMLGLKAEGEVNANRTTAEACEAQKKKKVKRRKASLLAYLWEDDR